jgi:hypothetical protein
MDTDDYPPIDLLHTPDDLVLVGTVAGLLGAVPLKAYPLPQRPTGGDRLQLAGN